MIKQLQIKTQRNQIYFKIAQKSEYFAHEYPAQSVQRDYFSYGQVS